VIFQGSSSGLAAATDPEEAALRATLELVERDAFLTAWLTACPGQRIELDDTLDPLLRRVLVGIEALGATVEVYTLPTDLDPCLALRQAVLELGQTGPYLRRMMRSHQLAVPDEPAAVQDMLQHAAYYFPRQRAQAFDRLRHVNGDVDGGHRGQPCLLRDLAEYGQKRTLINCAAALDAADIRVALVDVTSADVATGPFRVMRAVSPDLQPLSYGYGMDSQPVARIRNLGLASDAPAIHPIM
jgi:ribosomal protein S12 methylthiotransferase accessory factor